MGWLVCVCVSSFGLGTRYFAYSFSKISCVLFLFFFSGQYFPSFPFSSLFFFPFLPSFFSKIPCFPCFSLFLYSLYFFVYLLRSNTLSQHCIALTSFLLIYLKSFLPLPSLRWRQIRDRDGQGAAALVQGWSLPAIGCCHLHQDFLVSVRAVME